MAKGKWKTLGPEHPIFKEGIKFSSNKNTELITCPKCNSAKAIYKYFNQEHDDPSILEELEKKFYKVILMGGVEFGIEKEFICENCSYEWNNLK